MFARVEHLVWVLILSLNTALLDHGWPYVLRAFINAIICKVKDDSWFILRGLETLKMVPREITALPQRSVCFPRLSRVLNVSLPAPPHQLSL